MNREQFWQWIIENYNLPDNNCTMAPSLLSAILDFAEVLEGDEQYRFLCSMLPQIPDEIIKRVCL